MDEFERNLNVVTGVLRDLQKVDVNNTHKLQALNCRLEEIGLDYQPKKIRMENYSSIHLTPNEIKYRAEGILATIVEKLIDLLRYIFGDGFGRKGGGGGGGGGGSPSKAAIAKLGGPDIGDKDVEAVRKDILQKLDEVSKKIQTLPDWLGYKNNGSLAVGQEIYKSWMGTTDKYINATNILLRWFNEVLRAATKDDDFSEDLTSYVSGKVFLTFPRDEATFTTYEVVNGEFVSQDNGDQPYRTDWNGDVRKELRRRVDTIKDILNLDDGSEHLAEIERSTKAVAGKPDVDKRVKLITKAAKQYSKIAEEAGQGIVGQIRWLEAIVRELSKQQKR